MPILIIHHRSKTATATIRHSCSVNVIKNCTQKLHSDAPATADCRLSSFQILEVKETRNQRSCSPVKGHNITPTTENG